MARLIATVVLLGAAFVASNYVIDSFGLFRDPAGRALAVSYNERASKYLFAHRYIPRNFDGLLIGSSVSDNLDVSRIRSASVYNASINGGNVTEERLIANEVFARRHLAVVLLVIHPYLTADSGRKSGFMTPRDVWGALGSTQLIQTYLAKAEARAGLRRREWDASGRDDFDPPRRAPATVAVLVRQLEDGAPFNAGAFAEYGALLDEARRFARLRIGIILPVSAEGGATVGTGYARYFARARALFRPDEPIVDFNEEAFAAWRADTANFADGVHFSPAGAASLSALLANKVDSLLRLAGPCGSPCSVRTPPGR